MQNKWQQSEKDNAKRAAAISTTPAKSINVTPASLDNITEVVMLSSHVVNCRFMRRNKYNIYNLGLGSINYFVCTRIGK